MSCRQLPTPDPAPRSAYAWWYASTAGVLIAIALSNAFSERANHARLGDTLTLWEPLVWEFSSVCMIGVLLPALASLYRRFPFRAGRWRAASLIHALATVPFSLLHVGGMIGLRELVYALAGSSYDFGPLLSGWGYEYRKDFVTYWLILSYFAVFSAWRYWRGAHAAQSPAAVSEPAAPASCQDRLVVRKLNREFILDVADIARLESDGNYVTVHANGTTFQIRASLAGLSQRLDSRRFVQVHRRRIVNLDHVREIQPWDHGDYRMLLKDGSIVNFSRRYRAQLERLFKPPAAGGPADAARP